MSFYFNGAQANVTISGSSSLALPSATQTVVSGTQHTNSGTQNLYTVTAGKTFYLMGLSINNESAVAEIIQIKNNAGTVIFKVYLAAGSQYINAGYTPLMTLTTAQNLQETSSSNNCNINYWGIEQ